MRLPAAALPCWLGSVAVFGAGVAVLNDAVYGGPLKSGYQPGEVTFSLGALLPNLRYMPAHLIEAMPVLVPGLTGLGWIVWRWARLRKADGKIASAPRRDLAVGLALAASWLGVWGLYAAYTWTTRPGLATLQAVRFYVPAIGAMALLGAWLAVRVPRRASTAAVASAALVTATLGLGAWSFNEMRETTPPVSLTVHSAQRAPSAASLPGGNGRAPRSRRPA